MQVIHHYYLNFTESSAAKILNTDTCCSGLVQHRFYTLRGAGSIDIRSYVYTSSGEMAEREAKGVYCVGCGSDLASRSTNRRSLISA